jgi:hypothetical protein
MITEDEMNGLLSEWLDEMAKTDYYIPSASFTWDNVIDFSLWLVANKVKL